MRWFVVSIFVFLGLLAPAQASVSPFQLALVSPVQLVSPGTSISGLRLSLIYGENRDVTGLDLGIAGHTTGNFAGVQFSAVSLVDGDGIGWQNGWLYNQVGGKFTGLQSAAVTNTRDMHGLQWGFVNLADEMSGLQVGFFNQAQHLHGLQIGIIDVARNAGGHPVLVLVNWAS
jgi:hypothetical protein